ncbi:hypothetical protein [Roseiconus lacunae]|uniref:Uncharacterized protein n=1 Tax=Roseiconus lacunae TaxID=2605694 RepID=A0ABT7PBQ3_9BACT|nr:hypothetical protein [Roseiconus lacunae]MDM4013925.1 hypothetical protein [Roseiconus lacunae]
MQNDKPRRFLVNPGRSVEDYRQAVIDMFVAITGREATEDELRDLDPLVDRAKRERAVRELEDSLGRTPTEQEVNLYVAQADSLGEY